MHTHHRDGVAVYRHDHHHAGDDTGALLAHEHPGWYLVQRLGEPAYLADATGHRSSNEITPLELLAGEITPLEVRRESSPTGPPTR